MLGKCCIPRNDFDILDWGGVCVLIEEGEGFVFSLRRGRSLCSH